MSNLKSTIIIEGQNKAQAAINEALAGIATLKAGVENLSASYGSLARSISDSFKAASGQTIEAVRAASQAQVAEARAAASQTVESVRQSARAQVAELQTVAVQARATSEAIIAGTKAQQAQATAAAEQAEKTSSGISGISNSIKGLIAFSALKELATEFIHLGDEVINADAKIRLVSKSEEEFAQTQQALLAVSQKNSTSFVATAALYSRMALATSSLGYDTSSLVGVVDTLQKTFLLSGASAQEAKYGLLEFSHVMSEGKLQGRQLNALLMEDPVLLKAIADGLGTTTGKLREFSHDSSLSSQTILLAIESQKSKIDEMAQTVPVTFGRAMTQLSNSAMVFVDHINESNGILTKFAEAIITLSQHFEEAAFAVVAAIGTMVAANAAAVISNSALEVSTSSLAGSLMSPAGIVVVFGTIAAAAVNMAREVYNAAAQARQTAEDMGNSIVKLNGAMQRLRGAKTDEEKGLAKNSLLVAYQDQKAKQRSTEDQYNQLLVQRQEALPGSDEKAAIQSRLDGIKATMDLGKKQMAQVSKEYLDQYGRDIETEKQLSGKELEVIAQRSKARDGLKAIDKKRAPKEEKLKEAIDELDADTRLDKGITDLNDNSFKNDPEYQRRLKWIQDSIKIPTPKATDSAAEYNLGKAQIDAETQIIVDGEKRKQEALKAEYAQGMISLDDYQAKRRASMKIALEAELKDKLVSAEEAKAALAKAQAGGNGREIDQAKARQYTIAAEIKRAQGELDGLNAKSTPQEIKERQELNSELAKTATEIEQITSAQTEANIKRQVEVSLVKEKYAAEHAGTEQAIADYNRLLALKTADALKKGLVDDPKANVDNAAAIANERIQLQVKNGTLTQIDADKQLNQVRQQQVAQLQQLLAIEERIAGEDPTPKQALEIGKLQNQIASLSETVNTTAVAINQSLTNGLAGALDGILNRTMTWRKAFTSIFTGVAAEINKAVSGQLTHTFMSVLGMDTSKTGGFGGWISGKLFGSDSSGAGATDLGTTSNPMIVQLANADALTAFGLKGGSGDVEKKALGALGIDGDKSDAASKIGDSFTSMFSSITSKLGSVLSGFGDFLSNSISSIFSSISGGAGGAGGGLFSSALSGIGDLIGFADGGHVTGPGTGTSDSILARLSNGEFVMNARAVGAVGTDFLNSLNSLGGGRPSYAGQLAFATGGLVQSGSDSGGGGRSTPVINMHIQTADAASFKQSRGQIEAQMRLAVERAHRNL